MKVIDVAVITHRHKDGQYVLKVVTTYDEFVPGWRRVHKSKTKLWPEAKLENGRGMRFKTQREAIEYYLKHRKDRSEEGYRTKGMIGRLKKARRNK